MGRNFFAQVEGDADKQNLNVRPITHNISYYVVKKREVKSLARHSKGAVPIVSKTGAPYWGD